MKSHREYMADVEETVARIRQAIEHYGLTAEDLGLAPAAKRVKAPKAPWPLKAAKKGRKQKIRYRDGNGNTWSGQGSTPNWIKASGKPKEEFAVDKPGRRASAPGS